MKTREALELQVEDYLAKKALPDSDPISPTRLPVSVNLPLLDELRVIDDEMKARFVDMHGRPAGLHCLGLGLDKKLDDHRYGHCTPLNCRTFAGTGGDGHHFSFLVTDGAITESSPIVATAPDNFGDPSAVIAESLRDFLRMGCWHGFDALGHLMHQSDEEVAKYFDPEDRANQFSYLDYEREILAYLRKRLNLKPWTDWQSIRRVQAKYKSALRHPPDAIF